MSFESEDIEAVRQEQLKLPPTHRQGYGSSTDDVAEGPDGIPVKVPTPETPTDRF